MRRRPSRISACFRRSAEPRSLTLHPRFGAAARTPRQELRNGQLLPDKSIGFVRENLPWTLWYSNSWDLRCSRFASSCLPSPRGGRLPVASATTDGSHFQPSVLSRLGPPLGAAGRSSPGDKPPSDGNARLEFAPRPLTYQRFRQNAV